MTIEDKVRDEKLQYYINREVAWISVLWHRKIDEHQYLTGEETLPSNQRQIIEQAKFAYYLFMEKLLENKQKTLKLKDKNKQMLLGIESRD